MKNLKNISYKEFINEEKEKSMKTLMIYHSIDLDGWMSGAIVKHYFEQTKSKGDSITFKGWNYNDPKVDTTGYDQVIMSDISFPPDEMNEIFERLDQEFIWIDHHISAMKANENKKAECPFKGLRKTDFAACELTWKYFFPEEKMPEMVRLLGRYDCFGHKDTDEEQEVLEFQYAARAEMSSLDECYGNLIKVLDKNQRIPNEIYSSLKLQGKAIYKYLNVEAAQAYENTETLFLFEPNGKGTSKVKFGAVNKERFNPVNFGIDYHSDGYEGYACYWRKDNKFFFSIYNDDGKIDCSKIAKELGGGGHAGASGFIVDDLKTLDWK